jgi:hypothetical protein
MDPVNVIWKGRECSPTAEFPIRSNFRLLGYDFSSPLEGFGDGTVELECCGCDMIPVDYEYESA